MIRYSRTLALLLALPFSSCQQAPAVDQGGLPTVPLRIQTAANQTWALTVEVAITPADQERGLMQRKALPAGHGMVFPFPLPKTASFWMKDTPLALDLLFVRPDGTIAAILPGKPEDLTPISAGEPVSAVIEIAGGSAAALGIAAGDHVQWGNCPTRAAQAGATWDARTFCPALD